MSKRKTTLIALFSCLFSACVTAGRRITFCGDVRMKNSENYIDPLSAADVFLFLFLAAAVGFALAMVFRHFGLIRRRCLSQKERAQPVRFALLCAMLLLVAWLPYMLTVAPGNIYVDSLSSISQMLEHGHPTSNHHPMFYTLLVGVFMKIGSVLFDSVSIGILFYSLFQTCVMIFSMVCVLTLMYHKRISEWIIGASMLYFMFVPFFPNYAMSMWKDALFSCMLLLLCVLLYLLQERLFTGWPWFFCYGMVGIGAMMFRNNGLYVFAGVSVLAVVCFARRHARRLAAASLTAIAIFVSMSGVATRVWNIYSDFVENLGIPLLQMGYTINHDGEFSEADEAYLFRLMPEEVWNYAYRPCLVDAIKWNPMFDLEFLDETKGEFFKVWLSGLIKNPIEYVDAYLLATHGFWQPGVQNWYGYMDVQMNENPYGIDFMDLFEKVFGFSIMPVLKDYPVFMGSGTLLWFALLGMVLSCREKTGRALPYMPALLNWATVMIATPVAYSLRYVFVFALGLPFYLVLPLMISQEKDAAAEA